jgi:probable HAF family extracellular repeat protein
MCRSLLSAVLSLSILLSTLVAAQDASYTFTTFDVPGVPSFTAAYGINDRGQIVGLFGDFSHSFLKDGTTFTPLDVPDATLTVAGGINNGGQIVGVFSDATGDHGFVTDGTTFTPLDVPGATRTVAFGINDRSQIVGFFENATGTHGFLATP